MKKSIVLSILLFGSLSTHNIKPNKYVVAGVGAASIGYNIYSAIKNFKKYQRMEDKDFLIFMAGNLLTSIFTGCTVNHIWKNSK